MANIELNEGVILQIEKSLGIKRSQINTVLEMLNEGNTVPFIARYRKEATGALDEDQIREINKEYTYSVNLLKKKEDVIRLIDEKGLLTDDLKSKILSCDKLVDVEDLYRPFKEKKKTKATDALNNGLEPLAKQLMSFPTTGTLDDLASKYISEKVATVEDALQGAKYIIAEWISDNASYRKTIRRDVFNKGVLKTKVKKSHSDDLKVYEMYYEYEENLKYVKPHRVLAINRAEKEKVISVSIVIDKADVHTYLEGKIIKNENSIATDLVKESIVDSFKRLIFPSIERELRSELNEKAENNAIDIFAVNLKNLLLSPPMKGQKVLGVDPAYRTGCKVCVLDDTGKVLGKGVMYPHQKSKGEKVPPERIKKSKDLIATLIKKFDIDVIAIGNGTASRETEQFIADIIKETKNEKVKYIIVSEAGASVYSASKIAQDEFPEYSVEERSAVSIGRRLQDPLSELVKIDPKSIGVGQYQHDVSQSKLSDSLDFVVTSSVNSVGVDINTASKALLQYVSGLNKSVANNIVKYRNENGKFENRDQIKKVPKLGGKAFEQCAGFLRIPKSLEPLDITSIHPESYEVARLIMAKLDISGQELGKPTIKDKVKNINASLLAEELKSDEYTVGDILKSFVEPLRDPRDKLEKPILRSDVLHIEDLKEGMELHGTVRNVVDFGAFVDVGLKNDGLVHISRLSNSFVKHPTDVVSVGDLVNVFVHEVDLNKNKVSLTMVKA